MGEIIAKLENVSKIYTINSKQIYALQNINLLVNKGEFLIVKGASGCGKSTLLNIIGTLDMPSSGKVYLFGKDISNLYKNSLCAVDLSNIRLKMIGFIYQAFNLITFLTAYENIELSLLLSNYRKTASIKNNVSSLLDKVGLLQRASHYPSELSGGEQQRVAIARALINDPQVILADEPTGNLDRQTSIEIMDLMSSLHREGRTFIVATHDEEVAKRGTRVIDFNKLPIS